MSIGGGVLGSIDLGAAHAAVDINNDRAALNDLTATVMSGSVTGNAVIALNSRARSHLTGTFQNLDIGKLLALQTGRVLPLEGQTTGTVDLDFAGTNFRTATGSINADVAANAGAESDPDRVPVTGRIELTAANGLFSIGPAQISARRTASSLPPDNSILRMKIPISMSR